MVIIKEIAGNGAWWYKTAMDAYKDIQNNEFGDLPLPDRTIFIENMDNHIEMDLGHVYIFVAYEGDQ